MLADWHGVAVRARSNVSRTISIDRYYFDSLKNINIRKIRNKTRPKNCQRIHTYNKEVRRKSVQSRIVSFLDSSPGWRGLRPTHKRCPVQRPVERLQIWVTFARFVMRLDCVPRTNKWKKEVNVSNWILWRWQFQRVGLHQFLIYLTTVEMLVLEHEER